MPSCISLRCLMPSCISLRCLEMLYTGASPVCQLPAQPGEGWVSAPYRRCPLLNTCSKWDRDEIATAVHAS